MLLLRLRCVVLGCVYTTTLGVKTHQNPFGCLVRLRGAKRKSCTPKRKKTKTLAKVEEFENGNVLPDKFGCVNSRNGLLASFSVTFVPFSVVHTDPTIQKIAFTIFVMWRVLWCGLFSTILWVWLVLPRQHLARDELLGILCSRVDVRKWYKPRPPRISFDRVNARKRKKKKKKTKKEMRDWKRKTGRSLSCKRSLNTYSKVARPRTLFPRG